MEVESVDQPKAASFFDELGFSASIESRRGDVRALYLADEVPWVLGYSGGKDSTAVLQLTWQALSELPKEKLTKPVYVISTDTLVENPVVAAWVNQSLVQMGIAAEEAGLPIKPNRLTPVVRDSFWVGLLGKGYPAPRPKFRWCTERLKINPSNHFILNVVRENGEAILLLGTRRAESNVRARNMARLDADAIRERLVPNASLPNSLVYTPIEDWSNDDVWLFLMREQNPWGYSNKDLLTMYQGATEDGECPLVVDTTTPSCGSSRFGCWTCTLVDQDKSMGAMIRNDEEKRWMRPLLDFRNELEFRGDEARVLERSRRDFRRITGKLTYYTNAAGESDLVHGPYKQSERERLLRRLLQTQCWIRENAPPEIAGLELIQLAELQEIRRMWVVEKHEIEDLLPGIYEEEVGEPYPGEAVDDNLVFDRGALDLLRDVSKTEMHYEMVRNLLDVERRFRTMNSRRGLFAQLEDTLRRSYFESEEDALSFAQAKHELRLLERGELVPPSSPIEDLLTSTDDLVLPLMEKSV